VGKEEPARVYEEGTVEPAPELAAAGEYGEVVAGV
jgi:hypothetical protein